MVYGGLAAAMFNPVVAAITAASFYKLYKSRKAAEDLERALCRDEERKQFREEFRRRQKHASYEDYLRSNTWQAKRIQVIRRSSGRCESVGCTHSLDEVHHVKYPRVWGHEPIEWLIGLCEEHHREAHQIIGPRSGIK